MYKYYGNDCRMRVTVLSCSLMHAGTSVEITDQNKCCMTPLCAVEGKKGNGLKCINSAHETSSFCWIMLSHSQTTFLAGLNIRFPCFRVLSMYFYKLVIDFY